MLRHITMACLCLTLVIGSAQAPLNAEESQGTKFLQSIADDVVAVLADKEATRMDQEAKLLTLIERGFDVEGISKFVLGRFWKNAETTDQEKFLSLFPTFIVKTYSKWFDKYDGQTLELVTERQEEGKFFIDTNIDIGDPEPIKAQWVLHEVGEELKIIDFQARGINPRVTWKKEFQSVMQRQNGLVSLNKALEKKIKLMK